MSRQRPLGLSPARIELDVDGARALDYDDVYCSSEGGLAESRHVFIDGNDLPARFAVLDGQRGFVVGETGFGAGRNMLAAWACFDAHAPPGCTLHLFSIEKHPLARDDLAALGGLWPELAWRMACLVDRWPEPIEGIHRLTLSDRVTLDLYFGDVEAGLAGFSGAVDAWFLDGFAPARNPAMWSETVCERLAARSRPDATLATYSAAGVLRRALSAAGFTVSRRPGFGHKRHCLVGQRRHSAPVDAVSSRPRPWYSLPAPVPSGSRVAVIGAGIAGTTVAEALSRRGCRVTIYDRAGVASGASGNRDGVLNPRLAVEASPRTRFDLAALGYVTTWLAAQDPERTLWRDCGVLQLARTDREVHRQARLIRQLALPETVLTGLDERRTREQAGIPLAADVRAGLFFPGAGAVQPRLLCHALLARPGIEHRARDVQRLAPTALGWTLTLDDDTTDEVGQVVLACGAAAAALCESLPPLSRVLGQDACFISNDPGLSPACVLCDTGYILPRRNGRHTVGATYEPRAVNRTVQSRGHVLNHDRVAAVAPALASALDLGSACGRASWRCTSHDRMPLIGGVPDVARWRRDYAALGRDASVPIEQAGVLLPGLAVSVAHGSHGLLRAPLAAEMIASALTDTPQPVVQDLVEAVHPGRWLIRQIVRGRLAGPDDLA